VQTIGNLFTETVAQGHQEDGIFDPILPSYVLYPDGSRFQLLYNVYAELAQVTLPTGGKIQYDMDGYDGSAPNLDGFLGNAGDSGNVAVQRVLIARREYADGSILSGSTSYSYSASQTPGGRNLETATEVFRDANGNELSRTVHQFTGNPYDYVVYAGTTYNDWQEGKESSTTFGGLKTETNNWTQAGPVAWCTPAPAFCGYTTPEENPRNQSVTTTLLDTNQVSQVSYSYDAYNNITARSESDFGAGAPGPVLRQTSTLYKTDAAYIDASVNLVSLPRQQTVLDGAGNTFSQTNWSYDETGLTDEPNITVTIPASESGTPSVATSPRCLGFIPP
jgi:hypothetical protein